MKLLNIITVLCSWTVAVQTQNNQQQRYNGNNQINNDQIYFSDNRPGNSQYNNGNQNVGQDSYLHGTSMNSGQKSELLNQNNSGSNERRPSQQLSTELQPPPFDRKSDYSNGNNNDFNLESRQGSHIKDGQNNAQFKNISLAVTNFGLNLLKNMDQGESNVVISPFSIAMLLALLQQGALGATQQQISTALKLSPENTAELFKKITENMQKRSSRNILKVASNVFVADAFDLNPTFKSLAMRSFGSEVTPLRFSRPSEAVRNINRWVASKTNNKIEELLPPNAVGENSQLVLVNAIYFKGLWQVQFRPESTQPRDFHASSGARKVIPFMRMRRILKVGRDRQSNAQVIILPFENEQYSLMIVLPSELSSLDAVVSSLTESQLAGYHSFTPKEVNLEIPKFNARADTDLNLMFRKMGITNIFSQQAELSNLGTFRTHSPQVSSAYHTAMLSVNEEGGSAAAASAFVAVALSYDDPSIIFKVNRPFLAVLWDNQLDLPLFMARIHDPIL